MPFKNLLVEIEERVATLTINRPATLNALDEATLEELGHAMGGLEADEAIHAVVLTGAGEKAFVAGGDIFAMQPLGALEARRSALLAQGVLNRIEGGSKPVIAAVNGYALGGGCELAMACDLRIASETARFGQPEVKIGIIPGWGGTQRLPRLVGRGRALEMILTGEMIDAAEAYRIGLVKRVVPPGELLEEARRLARTIAEKGQVSVRLAREAVREGLEMDLERANLHEADLFALCFATEDQKEGMQAFQEKRPPKFRHR
ncbi:MAG: crotonase [Desulfuromonas sp.]|uniref:enoyl-CoA hydratase-related protein n=1 Tax=Desulfuromonas sp. TaxID=892 RepID=UPI000CB04E08|nr:enoyl-CoA hydratase-related protein [Desulfuromonas sp.]PLX86695.1 MAG: crotonase [Desulfuromonas sp.]